MISKIFTSEELNQVQSLIAHASQIVILSHMSPDGDAMGSSLGFRHWIKGCMPEKEVTNIVPNSFPSFLHWMPGAKDIVVYEQQSEEANRKMQEADLIICTDFNEPKRIGSVGTILVERINAGTPCIVIDHHIVAAEKSIVHQTLAFVRPQSPSASELVYRLIVACQETSNQMCPINLDAATCLYTGMMTDTGNFSFNSNYAEMYEIIANLVRLGVNKDQCYNQTFNAYTADRMRLMGYCLEKKMRIFPEYHLAFIYLSRRELYRFNFQSGDAEGIVNLPLQIKDVYYSCFMREDKVSPSEVELAGGSKIKVKISMRSQGNRPVNTFCHDIFGGGGHMNASGGEYYGSLTEAAQRFIESYSKYCKRD
ncbi:MAG: DHH family phosphoesterase [Bacteroidales bacterium]|nr:DHH family phosphoesterase [Candidatus Colicola coprequi]